VAVSRRNSTLVAAGILLSRVSGFVRQRAVNHFFGLGPVADAFAAAFRIPNLMQNLLGEGVLSASFIPVYARLLEEGRDEDAGRVAGAVLGLLAVTAGVISVVAVLFAEPLTSLLALGMGGVRRDLTVTLVRIITPGVGFLVLSAWCLGVLNSHRRFFLSYVAPVVWNLVQVVAVVAAGVVVLDTPLQPQQAPIGELEQVAVALAWGTLVGGLAQLLIQVPSVRRLEPNLRPSLRRDLPGVQRVLTAFAPIVAGRGVVQLSAYLDLFLASLLASGAIAALFTAQQLYMLPVSLFGMSVAAAELPELSRSGAPGLETANRLDAGLSSMAFYVVASMVVFVVAGDLLAGALFTTGSFGRPEEIVVWVLLAGFSIGLLATTSSRLLQSALYASGDARTPARVAAQRVVVSTVVGVVLMLQLDRIGVVDGSLVQLGDLPAAWVLPESVREAADAPLRLGALGLVLGGAAAAWFEFLALASTLRGRLGLALHAGGSRRRDLLVPALAASLVGLLARWIVADWYRLLGGPVAIGAIGLTYVLVARAAGVPEASELVATVQRRVPVRRVIEMRRDQRRRRRDRDRDGDPRR
jgi:putative peptidoglycan lipid II flippase